MYGYNQFQKNACKVARSVVESQAKSLKIFIQCCNKPRSRMQLCNTCPKRWHQITSTGWVIHSLAMTEETLVFFPITISWDASHNQTWRFLIVKLSYWLRNLTAQDKVKLITKISLSTHTCAICTSIITNLNLYLTI